MYDRSELGLNDGERGARIVLVPSLQSPFFTIAAGDLKNADRTRVLNRGPGTRSCHLLFKHARPHLSVDSAR